MPLFSSDAARALQHPETVSVKSWKLGGVPPTGERSAVREHSPPDNALSNQTNTPTPARPNAELGVSSVDCAFTTLGAAQKKGRPKLVEPILTMTKSLAMNPGELNPEGYSYFKRQQACLWTAEEVDTARDLQDYAAMTDSEQAFVRQILAFFASADLVVMDNLMEQFGAEVCACDLKLFFVIQAYVEAVHSETYSNLLTAIVKDTTEQRELFDAVNNFPAIGKKIEWMKKWTDTTVCPFAERLIAFAAVEGVFFSGAFCAVFWLKKRGLLPGLSFANELIARDEGLHRDFAVYVNNKRLQSPATTQTVHHIIGEAVDIETEFVVSALPVALIGMNSADMTQYIKFVADHLLQSLQHPKLYHLPNPFEWMNMISLQGKTNFFEKRVGEYALSGVSTPVPKHEFNLDTSF